MTGAHVVLITAGYAGASVVAVPGTLWNLAWTYFALGTSPVGSPAAPLRALAETDHCALVVWADGSTALVGPVVA